MKLEDLKVGDEVSTDEPVEGPIYVPVWRGDAVEWIKIDKITAKDMIGGQDG